MAPSALPVESRRQLWTRQVIEAHYLYGASYDNIEIVIHPQSIIHSMVETQDSSVLAQVLHSSVLSACLPACACTVLQLSTAP